MRRAGGGNPWVTRIEHPRPPAVAAIDRLTFHAHIIETGTVVAGRGKATAPSRELTTPDGPSSTWPGPDRFRRPLESTRSFWWWERGARAARPEATLPKGARSLPAGRRPAAFVSPCQLALKKVGDQFRAGHAELVGKAVDDLLLLGVEEQHAGRDGAPVPPAGTTPGREPVAHC